MIDTSRSLRLRTAAILLAAVASVALAGCSVPPGNIVATPSAEAEEVVEADVFTIAVGDCLNDGGVEGEISSVPAVECSKPHDSEAYASIIMEDGAYPGEDGVLAQADTGCEAEFDAFVGINYVESILDFTFYYPTAASWAEGDREILCLIFDPAGKITSGSLSGAAR